MSTWIFCDEEYKQQIGLGGRFLFIQVTLELRTASPAEADRSPRDRGACLLGELEAL